MSQRTFNFNLLGLMIVQVSLVGGCGEPTPAIRPNTAPAHGGSLLPLGPEGYVELVVEASGSVKSGKSVMIAYFSKEDGSGPIEPGPTDVSYSPTQGQVIMLKADAATPGRFASDPKNSLGSGRDLTGELLLKLNSEEKRIPVIAR